MRVLVLLPLLVSWAAPPAPAPSAHEGGRADLVAGLAVLREWDARRARAWASGEERALRALYVPGAPGAAEDVRLLRAYTARGIVVRRLVTQVFAVRVLRSEPARLRLHVFDRVAGGVVTRRGRVARLPSSPPATRVVALRRVEGSWRVAAVVPVSDWARAPRGARR